MLSVIVVLAGVASMLTASKFPPLVEAMVALTLLSASANTSGLAVTDRVFEPLVAPARMVTTTPLLSVTSISVCVA